MAFYIKPPEGFGALGKLRIYALRRMNFLVEVRNCAEATDFQQLLEKGATAVDSDCLIEGSRKDRISHFLLRLICCRDVELSSYMVKAETELFCHRFSCMNSEELVQFLQATHRFLCRVQRHRTLQETDSLSTFQGSHVRPVLSSNSTCRSQEAYSVTVSNLLHILNLILEAAGSWKLAVKFYMDYSSCVFAVPFQHALCLVASRQVMVNRGMSFVPFCNLHVVLAAMFEDILREGIRVAHHVPNIFLEDPRMRSISREVYANFLRSQHGFRSKALSVPGNEKIIREHQIDHLHHIFPPCMSHLHRTLRKKHRLRHFSRIQYTLFLKNIGLPVDDAIHFWRSEYSKPSCYHDNKGGGCQHSWAKDERRYIYSIRHLYGLEGSRINYRAHSCKAIQMMQLGYGEEGGCPLKHFDDPSLQGLMDIEEIVGPQREEIDSERQKGKYHMACSKYFCAKQSQINRHCDNRTIHRLEKNLKEASYLDGGCCQSGMCSRKPEVTRCTSKDELVKHRRLDSVSVKNTNVQNRRDMEHESDDTLMKRNIKNNNEMRTSYLQHSGNGNECTEVSIHKHLGSCQPSLNVDCASACGVPTTSCHIADKEIDTAESGIDVCHKCHSGDVTFLCCKSSATADLYSGPNCRCTKPLSMADSSMSETKNKGNTLKRESAIALEEGSRKVQKLTLALNESDVIVESAITKYEAHGEKNTIMHETKSVIAPSSEGDLVESPTIEKSREEVSSRNINLDGGFSFEGELSILRPSDFFYSFRRMVHDLNFKN